MIQAQRAQVLHRSSRHDSLKLGNAAAKGIDRSTNTNLRKIRTNQFLNVRVQKSGRDSDKLLPQASHSLDGDFLWRKDHVRRNRRLDGVIDQGEISSPQARVRQG